MDEFAEWGEGTTGFIAADSSSAEGIGLDGACGEQLWRHNHRDVVVCLVDCNEGMFAALPAVDSVVATRENNKGAGAQVSCDYATCVRQSTTGRRVGVDGGAVGGSSTAAHFTSSSFSIAMQSILALLKEKLLCRSKDIFAIVLYNTRVSTSSTGFRGVYVVQEATHVGMTCIQKVEHLEAAGVPGSTAYEEFRSRIGCLATQSVFPVFTASPESGSWSARMNIPASSVSTPLSAFSEVLWEAQRIFLGIRGCPGVHRRQLFVFTNCDDPSGGDAREWNVCRSRACDLSKEGVVLEVFGFGKVCGAGMSHPRSSSAFAGRSVDADESGHLTSSTTPVVADSICCDNNHDSGPPLFSILDAPKQPLDPMPGSTPAVGADRSDSRYSKSSPAAALGFVQDFFWGPLLTQMQAASTRSAASADTNDVAALAEARAESFINDSEGAVHVNAGPAMLQQLLISVMCRRNMQMPFKYCELRIGGLCGAASSLPDRPTAEKNTDRAFRAAAVPRMAVSVYIPFMRAHPLQRHWIDKRTNQVLRRVAHLHTAAAAAHGSDDSAVVEDQEEVDGNCTGQPRRHRHEADATKGSLRWREDLEVNDLGYYAQVGQEERVYLTAEERKKIVEVAAAGSEPGFTVLFFKDLADAVRPEHSVRRSAFLHSCAQRGGVHSHRLFVLFVRQLRAKKKVAIAQYCSSVNRAPRLVALVPSSDLTLNPEKRLQVPVDGLGLYVVPLPYAEELRPVPNLNTCNVDCTHKSPVLEDTPVDPTHLELARQIVSALTVTYRIDAVFNPALRLQFCKLQKLLRRRLPSASCLLYPEVGTALVMEEEDSPHSADGAMQELDNTLPDYEGMKSYAALFQSFNKEVLGNDYNASFYCPKLRSTESTARRPRDGEAGTMTSEGWSTAAVGESTTHVPIEEHIRQVAAENAWDCVTILQLKNYLAAMHVSTGGARRKADLVERIKQHLPPAA